MVSSHGIVGRRSSPGEGGVDHDRLRHAAGIVAPVEREIAARAAGAIAEMRVAPHHASCELLGVRVDQQLVRIEAQAVLGIIGAMHAIAVELARRHVVEIAVPDVLAALGQLDALDLAPALLIEQAKLHLLGSRGEQRKVGSAAVPGRAKGIRRARRKACATAPGREKLQPGAE